MEMYLAHLDAGRPYLRGPIGPVTPAELRQCAAKLSEAAGHHIDWRDLALRSVNGGGKIIAKAHEATAAADHAAADQAG